MSDIADKGTEGTFEEVDLNEKHATEDIALLDKSSGAKISRKEEILEVSPFQNASCFSRYLTFSWMNELFVKGSKKTLEEDDLYGPAVSDKAETLVDLLDRCWENELYDKDGNRKEKPSLTKAMAKAFGVRYILLGIFAIIAETAKIVQPILLGLLIRYFAKDTDVSKTNAYLLALGLTLCSVTVSLSMVPFDFLNEKYGVQIRVAVTGLVYKKVLKLSNAALAKTTTGYIVNLVSSDAQRLDSACFFLHFLWLGPIEVAVVSVLLFREIRWSAFAGIGLLLLLAPIQLGIGQVLMRLRTKIVEFTDERVKVMNEIIEGMRVIKLYTWENSFKKVVNKLRSDEIKAILNLCYFRAGFMSFFFSSASLISFVTFITYVLTGNYLTAQKVFTCVALFNSARVVMTLYFPIGITLFNDGRVALGRLQKLLMFEDIRHPDSSPSNLRCKPSECQVELTNVSASWGEDLKTLKNISVKASEAQLLAIVGPVGSGKSSLLMAILGELPVTDGSVAVRGKIAYASQQAWIFNGTLRYNITFGQEFDDEKYKEVLKVCALEEDIKQLPDGDLTLVGERGVSLSGGQKARVTLARAAYFEADIYIMDDPLCAVDARVGRHIFHECINGYLSKKIRILATHQLQYLHDADHILVLTEGECVGSGTFHELSESGVDFVTLLDEDDEGDSAIESDKEDDGESRERRFSRQLSCYPQTFTKHATHKPRGVSFIRQESLYTESKLIRSGLGIAEDTEAVKIFEEKELPKEAKAEGAIGLRTYINFFKSGYGPLVWFLTLIMLLLCQGVYLTADWWLSYWSNKEQAFLLSNRTAEAKKELNRTRDIYVYSGLVAALLILGVSRAFLFFRVILKSSESLHKKMFEAVLRAPIRFFDTVSVGRILNRFSKDTSIVDDVLSFTLFDFFQTGLMVLGILVLVSANNPLVFALVVPILMVFYFLRRYYIRSTREVKRIEGIRRSPVFGHFSTTLLGLPIIRAFGTQEVFTDLFYKYQDAHTGAWFTFMGASSWLGIRLDMLSTTFIAAVAVISVAIAGQLNPGTVGLILSYAMSITGIFQETIRQSTETENQMTSVERIFEYCDLEPEAPAETDHKPPDDWPKRGSIDFENMSFAYAPDLPDILHKVTCHIRSEEKIGVCGRTGAGKSSLLSTLFRTSEPKGNIKIDGENILDMGLYDLRSKLSIIPQDPVLFSGTVRKNLDPFDDHSDMEVWNALGEVQLKDVVMSMPGKLDSEMAESGSNLSVGQRQLVCLARAILRRNKILVIDEATANVDPITDGLIQSTIREKFKHCTVLTIAHRLNTIMDSDRIMVLDAGNLVEIYEPYMLLRCKNTHLYQLVAQTGKAEAQRLFDIARKAYYARIKKDEPVVMAAEAEMGALESLEVMEEPSASPIDPSAPVLGVDDVQADSQEAKEPMESRSLATGEEKDAPTSQKDTALNTDTDPIDIDIDTGIDTEERLLVTTEPEGRSKGRGETA